MKTAVAIVVGLVMLVALVIVFFPKQASEFADKTISSVLGKSNNAPPTQVVQTGPSGSAPAAVASHTYAQAAAANEQDLALTYDPFRQVFYMHIPQDASAANAALNAGGTNVNFSPQLSPGYMQQPDGSVTFSSFSSRGVATTVPGSEGNAACFTSAVHGPDDEFLAFAAGQLGFDNLNLVTRNFEHDSGIEQKIEALGFRHLEKHTVVVPGGNGVQLTYVCPINGDSLAKYVRPGGNVHNAINIPMAARLCRKWTYVNRYETAYPGKGTVKVFAGTFEYELMPLTSGFAFPGSGSASVKMYLDPDNGKWTVVTFDMHDPSSVLIGPDAPPFELPSRDRIFHCPGP